MRVVKSYSHKFLEERKSMGEVEKQNITDAIVLMHKVKLAIRTDQHPAAPTITLKESLIYALDLLKYKGCLTLSQKIGLWFLKR